MSLRARMAKAAALVTVGALALTGCDFNVYSLPLPGGADLGDEPYAVTVEFNDVLDLVPQSAVKVDDVTVGRVEDIALDGYTAEVTVLLRDDVKLPDNAEAQIRQTSLLGEKFVSLAPPATGAAQGRLGDGDRIPLERSGRNPEVEEVLGAMSLLLNGGGVAQMKTISTELNKALEGRESNVKGVLDEIDTFMSQIDDNKESIVQAIESNRVVPGFSEPMGQPAISSPEIEDAQRVPLRQAACPIEQMRKTLPADAPDTGVSIVGRYERQHPVVIRPVGTKTVARANQTILMLERFRRLGASLREKPVYPVAFFEERSAQAAYGWSRWHGPFDFDTAVGTRQTRQPGDRHDFRSTIRK